MLGLQTSWSSLTRHEVGGWHNGISAWYSDPSRDSELSSPAPPRAPASTRVGGRAQLKAEGNHRATTRVGFKGPRTGIRDRLNGGVPGGEDCAGMWRGQ